MVMKLVNEKLHKIEHLLSKLVNLPKSTNSVIPESLPNSNSCSPTNSKSNLNEINNIPPFLKSIQSSTRISQRAVLIQEDEVLQDLNESKKITNIPTIDFNIYLKMFIHELRTPISTISMGLDLLENCDLNDENQDMIKDLKQSVVFIEDIFLKFVTVQEGNIELNNYEAFSLKNTFDHVVFLLQYHIKEAGVAFSCHIHPEIYDWNFGDKYNINHCIINLLKNSIKYRDTTRPTMILVQVSVMTKDNEHMIPHRPSLPLPSDTNKTKRAIHFSNKQTIIIKISDNNNHILPHIKTNLFESFNSTSGSGLGLYICKNIIELHGGTIHHEFIQPIGNMFIIKLTLELCIDPSLQIHSSCNNMNHIDDNNIIAITDNKKPIMLLADDSILNRKMAYKIFKKTNVFNLIYTASDGIDVIDIIKNDQKNVNIILIDKHMPKMDGIVTTKELRKILFDQLIFGITGDEDNNMFLESGVDFVIKKPLDIDKINMIIKFIKKNGTKRRENNIIQQKDNCLEWINK
jgi:signal transduction histidine kinase/CheY-like chemotaxis protein